MTLMKTKRKNSTLAFFDVDVFIMSETILNENLLYYERPNQVPILSPKNLLQRNTVAKLKQKTTIGSSGKTSPGIRIINKG